VHETKEKSLQAADFRQAIGERKGKQNHFMPCPQKLNHRRNRDEMEAA
jgi:hypothetical protein